VKIDLYPLPWYTSTRNDKRSFHKVELAREKMKNKESLEKIERILEKLGTDFITSFNGIQGLLEKLKNEN